MTVRSASIALCALGGVSIAGCTPPSAERVQWQDDTSLASLGAPVAPALPAGADPGWWEEVRAHIEADARAFRDGGSGTFTSDQRDWTATVRPEGLVARRGDGELRLELSAWGREGQLAAAGPTAPRLGACAGAEMGCLRRVELPRPGLVEWWQTESAGVRQGWTLAERPPGAGALTLVLGAGGAAAERDPGVLSLRDDAGQLWSYGELAAFDADGRTLPAEMFPAGDGLVVAVHDAGARYPVTIDPVLAPEAWELRPSVDARFGYAVAIIGDMDGDGYDDVAVGAPGDVVVGCTRGKVFVYEGLSWGLSGSPAASLEPTDCEPGFGSAVAAAGDIDGDGLGDLLVAAEGTAGAGAAYAYYGQPVGLVQESSEQRITTVDPLAAGFGFAITGAGDLDGDGFADVAIGAPDSASARGAVYVYGGSASGLDLATELRLEDATGAPGDQYGHSVGGGGDINGDGFDDLLVGIPWDSRVGPQDGSVIAYRGRAVGLVGMGARFTSAGVVGGAFGLSVAGAGDFDGDGYDDAVVGGLAQTAHAFRGSASGIDPASEIVLGDPSVDGFGEVVAGGGDVNADGYDDIFVGAPLDDNSRGSTWGFPGSASGPSVATRFRIDASDREVGDQFGIAVATGGDFDGDGYDDVIVGASGTDANCIDCGSAYAYQGSPSGPDLLSEEKRSTYLSTASFSFGDAVAVVGDVDGDGFDDIVVGAPHDPTLGLYYGAAWLFRGGAAGPATTGQKLLPPAGMGTQVYFGDAVAGAGDVDGDGYDDVVIGARGWDAYRGAAWVFSGQPGGLDPVGVQLSFGDSTDPTQGFGAAVAAAGDVDGDGFDDVIVGAPSNQTATHPWGTAVMFHGSAAGISTTDIPILPVTTAGYQDQYAARLAGVGDVNGDGYDDVVVGASGDDDLGSGAGTAFVYLGSASGVDGASEIQLLPTTWSTTGAFGDSVAGAGDVDGDGYDDLLIGAPRLDVAYGDQGGAHLFFGGPSGPSSSAQYGLLASTPFFSDAFGSSVAGLGDTNGDGYGDIAVGAPGTGAGGAAFVYLGSASGIVLASETRLSAAVPEPSGALGASVAGGDVNGDGFSDVVVGEPYVGTTAPNMYGRALVFAGAPGWVDLDGDGADGLVDCDDSDASVYPGAPETPADAVDQDCDGYDLLELQLSPLPLQLGVDAIVTVSGAAPGATVALLYSGVGPGAGACAPQIAPHCVDLLAPTIALTLAADGAGVALGVATVPAGLPPGSAWFQAVETSTPMESAVLATSFAP